MPVQVAAYPGAVPVFSTKIDLQDIVFAAHINQLQLEVAAIASTLGTNPQATVATVKDRLVAIESELAALSGISGADGIPISGVTGLQTDLDSLQSQINSLSSSLSALSSTVSGLGASLTTETNTRGSAVTNLQNQINTLNTEVSALSLGVKFIAGQSVQPFSGLTSSLTPVHLSTVRKYLAMIFPGNTRVATITGTNTFGAANNTSGSVTLSVFPVSDSSQFETLCTTTTELLAPTVPQNGQYYYGTSLPPAAEVFTPQATTDYTFAAAFNGVFPEGLGTVTIVVLDVGPA